jgi:hypothetical protein
MTMISITRIDKTSTYTSINSNDGYDAPKVSKHVHTEYEINMDDVMFIVTDGQMHQLQQMIDRMMNAWNVVTVSNVDAGSVHLLNGATRSQIKRQVKVTLVCVVLIAITERNDWWQSIGKGNNVNRTNKPMAVVPLAQEEMELIWEVLNAEKMNWYEFNAKSEHKFRQKVEPKLQRIRKLQKYIDTFLTPLDERYGYAPKQDT